MATFRLDRWLVALGLGSRKEVGQLIKRGKVKLDNKSILKTDAKLESGQVLLINGINFILEEFVYYMMNKPQGVLSATRDKKALTVLDLLPQELIRPELFPAGRLDKDTEGFMLITNDGEFSHKILAPKNKVPKTYLAHLNKAFDEKLLTTQFNKGVTIDQGEESSSAELVVLSMGENPIVELTIYEGMFHQVKRMFLQYGLEVTYLKRIKFGGLDLDPNLTLGETKKLNQNDLALIAGAWGSI